MSHQPMEAECNERSPIATCLETFLRTADLHVEHEKAAGVALAPYRDGHDVADASSAKPHARRPGQNLRLRQKSF